MLKIISLTLTPLFQNSRIIVDTDTNKAVVVDPGGEVGKILSALKDLSASCEQIWLTHSHFDHCGGVKKLIEKTGAKLFAHKDDRFLRESVTQAADDLGLINHEFENCPEPAQYINDGDYLKIGSHEFKVLFTPGHTPGHVAFYNQLHNIVISGDSLFEGFIGRGSLQESNSSILLKSIKEKLLTLPPETAVMCGHGNDTSIDNELRNNSFLI